MKSLACYDLFRSGLVKVVGVIRLVPSCFHHTTMIFICLLEALMDMLERLHRKIFGWHTRNIDCVYQSSDTRCDVLTSESAERIEAKHL